MGCQLSGVPSKIKEIARFDSGIAVPAECNGTGYIERERVAPWIDRDTPPDLEAYDEVCELCQGDGEIETNKHEDDDES